MTMTEKLEKMMKEMNLNKNTLSEKTGIPYSTINNLWAIGCDNIKRPTLLKLCNFFGCSVDYLANDDLEIDVAKQVRMIPILGNIAAGSPILAEEHIEGYVPLFDGIKADFCLIARGDSMINVIQNGDIVYIKCKEEVEEGEIAAVLIDGEATLKRFYKHGDIIELRPENSSYKSMIYTPDNCEDIRILGKAVACKHNY